MKRIVVTANGCSLAVGICLLAICLASDTFLPQTGTVIGSLFREVFRFVRDPEARWMVLLCLCTYFVVFLRLRNTRGERPFWRIGNPDLWLASAVLGVVIPYIVSDSSERLSLGAITFTFGVVLGQGIGIWSTRNAARYSMDTNVLLHGLLALLMIASLFRTTAISVFEYRGKTRWSGPWNNPNLAGVLMATGVVLAIGLAVRNRHAKIPSWGKCAWFIAYAAVACCLAFSLLHSYSRGACVAGLCGLFYLFFQLDASGFGECPRVNWIRRNLLILAMVSSAIFVLSFWQFRTTAWQPARRAFSIGNRNDFSWRNRVAAWEGAFCMVGDRPFSGFGMTGVERNYENYYRPIRVEESAMQMNDYLLLATSFGLPASIGLMTCLWLIFSRAGLPAQCLTKQDTSISLPSNGGFPLSALCGSAALVLAVAFWLDGGLFKLSTASSFWILFGLMRRS
jgi:hypothetical protein